MVTQRIPRTDQMFLLGNHVSTLLTYLLSLHLWTLNHHPGFAGGIANLQNIDFMWYYDNGFRGPDPQGWSYVNPQTLPKPPGSANNFRWTRAGVCTDNPRLAGDCYHDNKFRITMFCPLFFNGQAPQTGPPLPALRARTIRTAFPADGAGFTAGQTTLDEAFSMAGEFRKLTKPKRETHNTETDADDIRQYMK